MANVITVETKSPTIAQRQVKTFAAFKIEPFVHSLIFGKGLAPSDTVKPSDIGMNGSTAKSSLGAAVSVPGFITGLAWSVCALAHGQRKVSALTEGLPSASAFAVTHAASLIKAGAGISAGSLETVLLDSLRSMLALPAPAKRIVDKATEVASEPVASEPVASEPVASEPVATPEFTLRQIEEGIAMLGSNLDNATADTVFQYQDGAPVRLAAIRDAAEERARELAEKEANYQKILTCEGKDKVAKIHALCSLASELGIKLTASQLKILDTLEFGKAA